VHHDDVPATRAIEADDLPTLLAMNNAAVPNVSELGEAELAELVRMAELARTVEVDGVARGFVLALRPGAAYGSANYAWFTDRYQDFLYVDRIVVTASRRDGGLGATLYDAVFRHAGEHRVARVTCEVNVAPPNPGSLRFHQRLSFTEVGTRRYDGWKQVTMLVREL
jgi:predicted GNAT superfamily acetyltransferase